MVLVNRVLAALALSCPVFVLAAGSGHEPVPMERAFEHVRSNLNSKPDNQGLQNARDRLLENRRRFDSRHETKVKNPAAQANGVGIGLPDRAAAVDQPIRPESVQRPERAERPERPEKVERPERPDHVARPELPQRGPRR